MSASLIFLFSPLQDSISTECVYWEQELDSGYGGWSEEGCQLTKERSNEVDCECDHLANFATVTDTSVEAETSIQEYTILGVGVSGLVCLMVLASVIFSK